MALAPDRPQGYIALAAYHSGVREDPARALVELPADNAWLRRVPISRRRWPSSSRPSGIGKRPVNLYRQAERLDPRSVLTQARLGGRSPSCGVTPRREKPSTGGLSLAPANLPLIESKAMVFLSNGDLAGAERSRGCAGRAHRSRGLRGGLLGSRLGPGRKAARHPPAPDAHGLRRRQGQLGVCLAQAAALKGDAASARRYAGQARKGFEEQLRAAPQDAQR